MQLQLIRTGGSVSNNNNQALEVLSRLRQPIAALHQRLDNALPLAGIVPTQQDYVAHLKLNYRWLTGVSGFSPPMLGYNRLCINALRQDLESAHIFEDAVTEEKVGFRLPTGPGVPWGTQHIIEGSSLSVSVLYQRLRHMQSLSCPINFFSVRSRASAGRWQMFRSMIEQSLDSKQMMWKAEQGAIATFHYFSLVMQTATKEWHESHQCYAR